MKRGLYFTAGLLVGMTLFGGGTAYAAGLMAEVSSQTFYVDGQRVYLQAYAIGGNNCQRQSAISCRFDPGLRHHQFHIAG